MTGRKTFTAGSVFTAADANGYFMDQVIQRFADTTARATALPSPVEGHICYLDSSNTFTIYSGTAWSTIGPLSGGLNNGTGLTYTPSVFQSNTPTLTINRAVYVRTGRWVQGYARVTMTSTGTSLNNIEISLPVAANLATVELLPIGTAFFKNSTGVYYADVAMTSSNTYVQLQLRTPGVAVSFIGGTAPTAALAVGDVISINFAYEAAADA